MPNFQKIYYADDDPDDLVLFEEALNFETGEDKVVLEIFYDGYALIKELENTESLPDLVLLDINMPRLNGFDTLAFIKNNGKWKKIPVAIHSTDNSSSAIKRASNLGAELFITKPVGFDKLRKIVRKCVYYDWAGPDFLDEYIKKLQ